MESNLDLYIKKITDEEPALLQQLSRETHQKVLKPRMISGHIQGRLLSLIAKILRPRHILEIGTFTGYATLCLAEGLTGDGKIHTIDKNEELGTLQSRYFNQSAYKDQIVSYTGDALEIIPKIDEKFDLVFIDADKKNYSNYFDLIFPALNQGGVIITDNVLWYGKVLEPTRKGDRDTAFIKAYNEKIAKHKQLENILLPIRDGILISRKI